MANPTPEALAKAREDIVIYALQFADEIEAIANRQEANNEAWQAEKTSLFDAVTAFRLRILRAGKEGEWLIPTGDLLSTFRRRLAAPGA